MPVVIKKWSELGNESTEKLIRQVLSEQLWLRGELTEPYIAESQVDLIAIERGVEDAKRVVATYSIKVSL
ncbi:MAG: hypothetical protein N2170_00545 [Bacteroidia bacterium]|nr:hypothetical protein [Bacteroidia bacterium]